MLPYEPQARYCDSNSSFIPRAQMQGGCASPILPATPIQSGRDIFGVSFPMLPLESQARYCDSNGSLSPRSPVLPTTPMQGGRDMYGVRFPMFQHESQARYSDSSSSLSRVQLQVGCTIRDEVSGRIGVIVNAPPQGYNLLPYRVRFSSNGVDEDGFVAPCYAKPYYISSPR